MAKNPALATNMEVDYVIVFRYATTDKAQAEQRLEEMLERLSGAGLATEVRKGNDHSVLVFIKVGSDEHMNAEIYRSRAKDWIHGVRSAEPAKDTESALEEDPLTEAERLRVIHGLITHPRDEGGAGITPHKGKWENVESVFALHDHNYNKEWIKKWSTQYLLTPEDLDEIRNRMGEKIAFYFAFTQSYFTFLAFPAGIGAFAWAFLGYFSIWYAIIASLWCVVFVEWWHHQERDLSVRWGVKGVSAMDQKRREFKPEHSTQDPITGETMQIFPAKNRVMRQALSIPFIIIAVTALGTIITSCFAIEVFISEVYSGPLKSLLVFLPTVILTTALPALSGVLTTVAQKLTDFENYETEAQYERSMTAKTFVLNFITSYLPLCLTSFVYVPFGSVLVPYLDVFSVTCKPFAENEKQLQCPKHSSEFEINPARLRKQVIYFTVTAQIVNLAMEVVVPYFKRQGLMKYKEMKQDRAAKNGAPVPSAAADDPEGETDFLARVRNEVELEHYDVQGDLKEMVVQFGYLAMFSVVWPLAPLSFLINNWIELRADAVKICIEMRRPVPWRADSIGPWLNALSFIAWLGSITMSALVYLFSNDGLGPDGTPSEIKGWALLLSIFFSEHLYLLTRWLVATAISKIDSPGRQKERRAMTLTRRKVMKESMERTRMVPPPGEKVDEVTRSSLEEDARQSSLRTSSPVERFWDRQRGWKEAAKIGRLYIERDVYDEKSSQEKKEL
ncbi:hypothetical protein LTR37_017963 [Vermiconidia calcicola]|uniref:Uncharacterized protein n=1 Tax=Vermiconidia calcicola TaxID=1690605 RepID=A0ACC3MIM4_9PEZI|nr:hypothetical protein LTR37_017963 [Vermiconidia calcicola]